MDGEPDLQEPGPGIKQPGVQIMAILLRAAWCSFIFKNGNNCSLYLSSEF
jgi:hypothetical protein